MVASMTTGAAERRASIRLAASGTVEAVLVNEADDPLAVLEGPLLFNVSAGGMALIVRQGVAPETLVRVTIPCGRFLGPESETCWLRVVDCSPPDDGRCVLRLRLMRGFIPAELVYGWFGKRTV